MGKGKKISDLKVKRILEKYFAGDVQSQIANALKVDQSTVSLKGPQIVAVETC